MSNALLERIRSTENLPSLPTVAIEVLKATRKDDVTANELATVIQNDPGLTAKILKVVNSPLFGVAREISSLRQAISMLGIRTVRVMALSFSLVETVSKASCEGFDFRVYWRQSLTTGVAARLLARCACPGVSEEAFVAGLLSEVGIVAAMRSITEEYSVALRASRATGRRLADVEIETFGMSHATMGAELLRGWGLPSNVCAGVAAHHGENLDVLRGDVRTLANVVYCASDIAALFGSERPSRELYDVRQRTSGLLGMGDGQLDEILQALTKHVSDAATLLNVQIAEPVQYAELQAEAAMQLAQLSVAAEIDRVTLAQREEAARDEAARLNSERRAILEVAATDSLTKVNNRAAFDKQLDELFRDVAESNRPIALIMLDVDHFKRFNDMHGHRAGDEVLRAVGDALRKCVAADGFVARYGGEEFVVLLSGSAARSAHNLAERVRQRIEATVVEHEGSALRVTASFGVATALPGQARNSGAALIEQADQKLYQSKRNGRNRVT